MNGSGKYDDGDLLRHIFTYHAPSAEDVERHEVIRDAARHLAAVIVANTCADQTDAIRKVREAVMTANAAIASGPRAHGGSL